jgi:hypothetical protein
MPGPKPLSLAKLQHFAWVAGRLFFAILRGRSGRLCKLGPEPMLSELYAEIIPATSLPAKVEETWKRLHELNEGIWVVERWVSPAPELWKRLRNARSAREIEQVAKDISRWESSQGLGYTGNKDYDFPRALQLHASAFVKAKTLPEYPSAPQSKRPRSDEKRAWFFAKVLAGLMLGRSPLYALRRLSGWRGEPYLKIKGAKP